MGSVTPRLLLITLVFLVLGLTHGDEVYNTFITPKGPNGEDVISATAMALTTSCYAPFLLLRTGTTNCVAIANPPEPDALGQTVGNYTLTELGCPETIKGSTDLRCVPEAYLGDCFFYNPAHDRLIQWRNMTVYRTFTLSTYIPATLHPTKFHPYIVQSNNDVHIFFLTTSNVFWRGIMKSKNNGFDYFVAMNAIITGEVVHFAEFPGNSALGVAYKDVSYISFFFYDGTINTQYPTLFIPSTPEGEPGSFPELTDISYFGWTWDSSIAIYDAKQSAIIYIQRYDYEEAQVTKVIPTPPLKGFWPARSKFLLLSNDGVFSKMEREFVSKITGTKEYYCSTSPGAVSISIAGGDFPIIAIIVPDTISVPKLSYDGTIEVPVTFQGTQTDEAIIFDDDLARLWQVYTPNNLPSPKAVIVNNTVISPYSGVKCLRMVFSGQVGGAPLTIRLESLSGYQPTYSLRNYEYLELWINLGNATQTMEVCLSAATMCVQIYPGSSYKANMWHQIKWHLPTASAPTNAFLLTTTYSIYFRDKSGNGLVKEAFYVDYVKYSPYTSLTNGANQVDIYDACTKLYSYRVSIPYKPLTVNVESKPISCNPNSTVSQGLTQNGALIASVVNAAPGPVTYNWTLNPSVTTATYSGLSHMANYITLYAEGLNKSWSDETTSSTYSFYSTAVTPYSGLYSLAFTPASEADALVFRVYPELTVQQFPTLEFWMHGGTVGYQTIKVSAFKTIVPAVTFGAEVKNTTYGTAVANKWIKISMAIGSSTLLSYNTLIFAPIIPNGATIAPSVIGNIPFTQSQPTMYFDDIVLIGRSTVLTVKDSRNCEAKTSYVRVVSPPEMKKSTRVVNAKCYNQANGAIIIGMEGGTPPYTYSWSHDATHDDNTLTNIGETLVSVNITDSAGCKYLPVNASVLQPPDTNVTITTVPPVCYGGLGRVTASASGGSGIHTYSWLSSAGRSSVIPQPAPDAIFLDEISPFFRIINGNIECQGTGSHIPSLFSVSASHSGYCALSLFTIDNSNTTIEGSLSNETYSRVEFWLLTFDYKAFETTTVTLLNMDGTYSPVTLAHINPNAMAGQWNKFELSVTGSATGVSFSSGLITASVYVDDFVAIPLVANSAGSAVLSGFQSVVEMLGGVNYFLTVIDSHGCEPDTITVNLPQPDAITISYDATNPTSETANDASVTVKVAGGTGEYRFLWAESGSEELNAHNLAPGDHMLTVWDAVGCSRDFTIRINTYAGIGDRVIREYNSKLSSGLAALVGIGFLICLFSATMLYRYWLSFSTLGSFLSSMVLVGCVLSFLAALVLLPEPTDALCTSFIWFLGIGFVLVYGCLFIKTWALYKVWRNAVRYQKANLTPLYIIKCLCLAVCIEIVFLAIWTAIDPPKVRLHKSVDNSAEYQCDTKDITFWIVFLVVKGIWLIFGAVLSVLTRNIAKEYNESSSISIAIYNNVLLGAIAIPLAILLGEVPGGRLVVMVVIICIAYCFTMVVIFFKIWHSIMLPEKIPLNNNEMHQKRNTASSTGSLKSSSIDRSSRDSRSPPLSSASRTESQSEAAVYAV